MNSPSTKQIALSCRCPVCDFDLGASMAYSSRGGTCPECGYYMWCRMKTVGNVTVLDVLPDRIPPSEDRLTDSLAGTDASPRVILCLGSLDLVDSLFLARLLILHRRLQECEGKFVLCCLQPLVRDVLASTKLDTIFEIAEDEQAALANL